MSDLTEPLAELNEAIAEMWRLWDEAGIATRDVMGIVRAIEASGTVSSPAVVELTRLAARLYLEMREREDFARLEMLLARHIATDDAQLLRMAQEIALATTPRVVDLAYRVASRQARLDALAASAPHN